VRLLAYLGVIALLSMAGAHFSKSPKVMGAITPVHQGWIDIERPFAAFVVPVGKFPLRDRFTSQENATSTPIAEMVVNSPITSHRDGAKINPGKVTVSGIAWDGGHAVSAVRVSTDGGRPRSVRISVALRSTRRPSISRRRKARTR